VTEFDWRAFLAEFSSELLADPDIKSAQTEEAVESRWLGFHGATEEELGLLEARLEVTLPPSYRQFLAASNGWRSTGYFIDRLWSTGTIRWFRDHNQEWIDAYVEPAARLPAIPDEDYLVYGERQTGIRVEYLQNALEISDEGDSAILLLNPAIVTDDGEWEAWFFANWMAGAERYPSFRELMQAQRRGFLDLFNRKAS
jgi:hypothetical protein